MRQHYTRRLLLPCNAGLYWFVEKVISALDRRLPDLILRRLARCLTLLQHSTLHSLPHYLTLLGTGPLPIPLLARSRRRLSRSLAHPQPILSRHMVASVAVIQGAGGSIGSHFARHLLIRSSLSVVGTSRDPSAAKRAIFAGLDSHDIDESRLKVYEVDVREEETIRRAAHEVEKEFGKKSLRLLINASGVVRLHFPHPDRPCARPID